ncbi:MAG: Trm112 family protein [Hyphomicrobiales bacterium]
MTDDPKPETPQTNSPADASPPGGGETDAHGGIDPKLLDLLVCPLTKKTLRHDVEANELVSEAAGLAYPIRGGVPILLPSEARSLRDDDGDAERAS